MNLTLKQLFKFGAVCTCACALSASAATNYVEDSFEYTGQPNGGDAGKLISQYNYTTYDVGIDTLTNYAWFADSGDVSAIASNDASYAYLPEDGPITNGAAELILNLETEGNTLSRTVGVAMVDGIVSTPVYIDTLVQFTPSEDDPDLSAMTDVKVALFVNAETNLVVVHDWYYDLGSGYAQETTNSVVAAVEAGKWYRLTMKVMRSSEGDQGCQIWLDGNQLMSDTAFDVAGNVNGGPDGNLFLNTSTSLIVDKISFQGTGLLDELVVSDTMPMFPDPIAVEITLVVDGGTATYDPGPHGDGDSVTITVTEDWKWIDSLVGPIDEAGDVMAKSITTTLSAADSCTVTALVTYADMDQTIGLGSYPYASVGPWADDNGLGEGDTFTEGMEDNYLLNISTNVESTIEITSIVVDDVAETVTVTVGASVAYDMGDYLSSGPNFTDLNGNLNVYATDDLGVGFVLIGSGDVSITPAVAESTVVIDISGNSYNFIKAKIE